MGSTTGVNPYLLLAVAEDCPPGLVTGLLDPQRDPAALLRQIPEDLPPAVRRRLSSPDLHQRARQWLDAAKAHRLQVLTPDQPDFPARLRGLPLRPNLLFADGDLSLLQSPLSVAVIGSRTPTPYGREAAEDFARAIGRAGVPIWSGLALGVDGIAHRGACSVDAPTVAVLAGGLDQIYPAAHAPLAAQILAQGGLLLSEAPCGRRAQKGHFPRRNRILAGACHAVLVVEAGLKSGSLHSARFAAEYGTQVYALPGPYQSPRSTGCHALIREGAQLAASPAELLRELGVQHACQESAADGRGLARSADAEAVLQILRSGPRPYDLVRRESQLQPDRFDAALEELEDRQLIRTGVGDLLHLHPG